MKKIIIVSSTFYPINSPRSFRTTELVKEFSIQGHQVTVLIPKKQGIHNTFEQDYPNVKIKDIGKATWKTIRVSGSRPLQFFKRSINRIGDLFFEYPNIQFFYLTRRSLRKEKEYDVLISIAVPFSIHWGVASLWRNEKIANVWIADCGDPFMLNKHDTFKKMFYFHYFENKFLNLANFITVPFKEMKLLFNQKYSDKFRVIPQGFKFDNIKLKEYKKHSSLTFAFSGTIIPGSRDPFSLIDYLISNKTKFKFILYNQQSHLFEKYSDIIGSKLFFRIYIPREQLIEELSTMDFLVNVNTDSVNGVINAIPTKLIDYRLAERPILSFEQNKLPKSIVNEFLNESYQNSYFDKDFDRYNITNVAKSFLELF